MKIRLTGAELFRADGHRQADKGKLKVGFHNFEKASKDACSANSLHRH